MREGDKGVKEASEEAGGRDEVSMESMTSQFPFSFEV